MQRKALIVCLQLHLLFIFFMLSKSLRADDIDMEYINQRVTQEIINQVAGSADSQKCFALDESSCQKYGNCAGDKLLCIRPNWPVYSPYFLNTDFFQFQCSADFASEAYSHGGRSQDLSKLAFGDGSITIKDILLVSKLANQGKLGSSAMAFTNLGAAGSQANVLATQKNNYLSILANQEIFFDASMREYGLATNYARYFESLGLTIGLHVPIKIRHHRLKLINELSQDNLVALNFIKQGKSADGTTDIANLAADKNLQFFQLYPGGLQDFVVQILNAKGISFNNKATITGIGDIIGYANVAVASHHTDACVMGASVLFPTAQGKDPNKLWPSDLGNGGFVEIALYSSALWNVNRFFNPYTHCKFTYGFAASLNRRVPKRNTYDGTNLNGQDVTNSNLLKGRMLFGETLTLGNIVQPPNGIGSTATFSEPDSSVRRFADQTANVRIRPGQQFFFRVGDVIESVFCELGFFDISYDFLIKGKDKVSEKDSSVFVPDILVGNTDLTAHVVSAYYNYQCTKNIYFSCGLNYTFAGTNTPKTFTIKASLSVDF